MPPKASNKRKRASTIAEPFPRPDPNDPDPPVVFKAPGLKPDVKLQVFWEEFHVHSVVLKLYSDYFRRFLDSADKEPAPAHAPFRYDYATVVDEDGTWALEPASKVPELTDEAYYRAAEVGAVVTQVVSVHHLLSAMYQRPYKITALDELKALYTTADFYRALPVASASLTAALLNSKIFDPITIDSPKTIFGRRGLLFLAKKFRNPALFREAYIHAVRTYHMFSNLMKYIAQLPKVERLVMAGHIELCHQIANRERALVEMLANDEKLRDWCNSPDPKSSTFRSVRSMVDINMFVCDYTDVLWLLREPLRVALIPVLANNLNLRHSSDSKSCREHQQDTELYGHYLCAQIADEEMPWDIDETDW